MERKPLVDCVLCGHLHQDGLTLADASFLQTLKWKESFEGSTSSRFLSRNGEDDAWFDATADVLTVLRKLKVCVKFVGD